MLNHLDFLPVFTAFFLAILFLVIMTPFAHQLGLVDEPSGHRTHSGLIPLTGGVAIYGAVVTASVVTDVWFENRALFLTDATLIVLLGMLDDKFELSAKGRLLCQFIVACIMALVAQNHIMTLGNISGFGDFDFGIFGYLFTLICVVGVINAFNMIDGIDGLAAGMSLIALLAVVFLLLASNNIDAIMAPMMLIAAIIPFMAFNLSWRGFKGNKIFLGDSGSMFVGLTIVWLLVDFTQGSQAAMRPVAALWIIGLPLMDMVAIMFRRARKGRSVLKPDRHHLHNIFMRAGYPPRRALTAILFMGFGYALIGITGEILDIPEYVMFWGFVLSLVVYTFVLQYIWTILRFVRSYQRRSLTK